MSRALLIQMNGLGLMLWCATYSSMAASGWFLLVLAGSQIVTGGLMLALPLIASLLTLNLAMGILNRVSPQFSIFSVGLPVTLLAGIAMLMLLMPYMASFMAPQFAATLASIGMVLQGLTN